MKSKLPLFLILFVFLLPIKVCANVDSLKQRLEVAETNADKVLLHIALSEEWFGVDKITAFAHTEFAIDFAHQSGNVLLLGQAYKRQGDFYFLTAKYEDALKSLLLSEAYFEQGNYQKERSNTLNSIGRVYAFTGHFYEALLKFKEVEQIILATDYREKLSSVYNNLGVAHYQLEHYDLAREYYRKALDFCWGEGDDVLAGMILNNIGEVALKESNYEEAKRYFKHGIVIHQNIGEIRGLGLDYTNLAKTHILLGDLDSADIYFDKALLISEDFDDRYALLETNNAIAAYQHRLGNHERAINLARRCLSEARELGVPLLEKEALNTLFSAHESLEQFKEALHYNRAVLAIDDSLNNARERYNIRQVEQSFDAGNRIRELEAERMSGGSVSFLRQEWLILMIFFILLSILIIFLEVGRSKSSEAKGSKYENVDYIRSIRILYVTTAVFYTMIPAVIPTFTEGIIETEVVRIVLSSVVLIVYFLTYVSSWVRIHIRRITQLIYLFMIGHHFMLIYMNSIPIENVLYLTVLLSGVTVVFKKIWGMIAFVVVGAAMTVFTAYIVETPFINPYTFVGIIVSILVVGLLVSSSQIDLDRHLKFSNEAVNEAEAIVFIMNRKGENIYTNSSVENILGYHPDYFIGHHDWIERLGVERERANKVKNNLILIAIGVMEPAFNPYQLWYHKNGEMKWVSVKEKRLDRDRVLIIAVDVTEHKKIQDELAESEHNFRQINETLTDVFYLYNIEEDKCEYVSPHSKSVLGVSPEFFYAGGNHASEYVFDADKVRVKEAVHKVRKGVPFDIEYRIKIGKEIRWIREKSSPVMNEDHVITKNSGLCQDITERKKAEEEIRRLSLVASYTDNFILMVNRNNRVEWANQSFYKLTGFCEKEVLGRLPLEIISGPLTSEKAIDEITKAIFVDRKQVQLELINYKKDESIFYSSIEVTPLIDKLGRLEEYFVIGKDISQRIADQKQIQNLSMVASNTSNYIIIAHFKEGIEWVNQAFIDKFGYTQEEMRGEYPSRILHRQNEDIREIQKINETVFQKGQNYKGEIVHYTREGKAVYANVDITPLRSPDGKIERYFVIGVDISERKEYEDTIKKIADQLDIVRSIEKTILTSESTESIIYNTLDKTLEKLPVMRASLALFNEEEKTFYSFARMKGNKVTKTDKVEYRLSDFSVYEELKKNKQDILQNLAEKPQKSVTDEILLAEGSSLVLMSPLFHGDHLLGSLNVCFKNSDQDDTGYYIKVTREVANGLAIAIWQSQLKDKLSKSNQAITSSIDYAKMIQQAYIPDDISFSALFENHLIINKPKDIVSGDFYWVGVYGTTRVLVVGDCTGHGVPGAFMTIIGISELRNIVLNQGITDPGTILSHLNEAIINALASKSKVQLKDGMDVGIFTFNTKTGDVKFGGARRPLCRRRVNGEVDVLPPTKRSIGDRREDLGIVFETVELEINEGDTFYLYSDGCTDQFGGDRLSKFSKRRLLELIGAYGHLPMNEQSAKILAAIEDWQGGMFQTDDILFVGFKVD